MHKLIIRKGEHMMKKLAEILQKGSIVRKKQRGITLIALVVTIIVLLILARNKYKYANRTKWDFK